jgi:hypothetical protein
LMQQRTDLTRASTLRRGQQHGLSWCASGAAEAPPRAHAEAPVCPR